MDSNKAKVSGNTIWIIVGFILSLGGGLVGAIMGVNYAFSSRYDKKTKRLG